VTSFSITLAKSSEALLDRIVKRTDRESVFKGIDQLFERHAALAAGHAVKNYLSGQRLNRRTGSLARSVVGRALRVNGIPAMEIGIFGGPAARYAGIQEHGGVIVPKRAKALAMPVGGALTAAGVPRWASPRDYPGELRFVPGHRGIGVLVDANTGEVLWRLLRKVVIKPRHYLRDAMLEELPRTARTLGGYLRNLALGRTGSN
jgi:hypothetical protein